jgi:hypothetical protein
MLHKMGIRSGHMYLAGVASIGLSFAAWLTSKEAERASLARADRWGIFIGQWAPSLFALGVGLAVEETRDDLNISHREEALEREPVYAGTR